MDLTPLRQRGKYRVRNPKPGRKPGRPPPSAASATTHIGSRDATKPSSAWARSSPTTTAMISQSGAPQGSQANKRRKLSYAHKPQTKANTKNLSRLECLPAELLQSIFLECMNVALPRSSVHVARKLVSPHMHMAFSLRTLHHIHEKLPPYGPQLHTTPDGTPSFDDIRDLIEQLSAAQSRLLACKFFTWTFYKDYMQRAYEKARRDRAAWQKRFGRNNPAREDEDEDSDGDTISSRNRKPPAEFLRDPTQLRKSPDYLRLLPKTQIPEKLLRGPWTEDKQEFLYFLVWQGLYVDWTTSSAGETATQGVYDAISSSAKLAIIALTSKGVGVRPTTDMLRYAVRDCGCEKSIVFHVLARSVLWGESVSVNYQDPELWDWADREERLGNTKGRWLREKLKMAGNVALGAFWEFLLSEPGEDPRNLVPAPRVEIQGRVG